MSATSSNKLMFYHLDLHITSRHLPALILVSTEEERAWGPAYTGVGMHMTIF